MRGYTPASAERCGWSGSSVWAACGSTRSLAVNIAGHKNLIRVPAAKIEVDLPAPVQAPVDDGSGVAMTTSEDTPHAVTTVREQARLQRATATEPRVPRDRTGKSKRTEPPTHLPAAARDGRRPAPPTSAEQS